MASGSSVLPTLARLREDYYELQANLGYRVTMSQDKKINTNQNLTRLHTGELSLWFVSELFLT